MQLETTTRTNASLASVTSVSSSHLAVYSGRASEVSTSTLPLGFIAASADSSGWQGTIVQADQFQFSRLAKKWLEERGVSSSTSEIALCPSYQRIIAMGEVAIPLILAKLKSEGDKPDMWFWALKVISNEDPVADSDRGNWKAMARAWLLWGQERDAW